MLGIENAVTILYKSMVCLHLENCVPYQERKYSRAGDCLQVSSKDVKMNLMASVIGTTELAKTFSLGKKENLEVMINVYKISDTEGVDMKSPQPL